MLTIIFYILIVIATFLFMEFMAWFTHKYIMHGFMWIWHESHHQHRKGPFERNDLFAVVFSIPAALMIILGSEFPQVRWLMMVGFGVTAYGIFYVLFHDILVHRRINLGYKPKSRYMKRIMNAHYIHHHKHTKDGCESFGFLYAPKKYESSSDS
jgi:beta-carotene 3-hydroxylase